MILKERLKSVTHLILESLNHRMALSFSEKIQYDNQVKGYLGEQRFDACMSQSQVSGLVINDLLLSTRDTSYQIDSLLITPDHIYLYEVKNYSGPCHYKDGCIFSESGHALQNPVAQAERKRSYLYNLLLNTGHPTEITSHVVFIDPEFYIYSLPAERSIIFAGQLEKHFSTLPKSTTDSTSSSLTTAEKLVKLHNDNWRPASLPAYDFDQLKKGIICPECFSYKYSKTRQTRVCAACGHEEKIAAAIYRSTVEFTLLFPSMPVKKHYIYEWCGRVYSKSRIQEVLKTRYRAHYAGRGSYYS